MPRAAHDREPPGGDGREQGDVFRVFAQQALGSAHEHIEAAGCLQGRGAPNDRQNG